ncbi:hypothetical protein [uncultured Parasutterella sp.]|uniref:hypothetical protein n=1 Tax=uncultured Parasutterella sp. TaxID=1263098 RepID=UPI0025950540|nr:hypothetical protein [uncultured Parasutterella sp.]
MHPIISLPCNEFLYEKISEQLEEALESELDDMENGDKFKVFIGLDTPYLDSPQEMLFLDVYAKDIDNWDEFYRYRKTMLKLEGDK